MLKKILIPLLILPMLCGCFGREPNDTAYVVGLGIDKAPNDNYDITIQFARPSEISGGGSEEGGKGGKNIVENIAIEAPDIYSAINMANHLISKHFSLSHAKIAVFSSEVAKDGIKNIMETLNRSDEVRPDLILAVSRETARGYLENTKPIVEVNPSKYYQLIYEKNDSGGIPKMTGVDAMFCLVSTDRDIVMPLAGVAKSTSEGSSNQQSSSGGQQSGGGQSGGEQSEEGTSINDAGEQIEQEQEKENQNAPINSRGFQYKTRDYKAGQVKLIEEDKSEALGMAIFKGDKLINILGETEADIYNILKGDYKKNYTSFYNPKNPQEAVTVRMSQAREPIYKIDKDKKKLKVKIYLEGDFYTLPFDYNLENDVEEFEKNSSDEISRQCTDFIKKMRDEYNIDILGIEEISKRYFFDMNSFSNYNWKKQFKEYDIKVETKFKIRHSGITYRE